jgi:CxxC motif-containing protein (DUF1111 family)
MRCARRTSSLGAAVLCALSAHAQVPGGSGAADEVTRISVGKAVFGRHWAPAGTAGVGQGLGPLFNADSCSACHGAGGEGGKGPSGDGPAPAALVVQLETPAAAVTGAEPGGDPVYGHVFNTSAVPGVQAEGVVLIHYREDEGHYYPDGFSWRMRVPRYRLSGLSHGPLARTTVIKPRLAPSMLGIGWLEAVPEAAIVGPGTPGTAAPAWDIYQGVRTLGRFGWQGGSVSIRDQTTKALAREMGLTSRDQSHDDCTAVEEDCLRQPNSGSPEVADEVVADLVSFERTLAVPDSPRRSASGSGGAEIFARIGCADCHQPELPVERPEADGKRTRAVITPYTDLRLHDLGSEMADEDASGARVASKWRTAPLWGLGYRVQGGATLLHDGRARSPEEAILWHSGEAGRARRNFVTLLHRQREALLQWLETL